MNNQNLTEIERRRAAVENTIATQQLEGNDIDPGTLAQMQRYAAGEVSSSDLLAELQQRVARGEFGPLNP